MYFPALGPESEHSCPGLKKNVVTSHKHRGKNSGTFLPVRPRNTIFQRVDLTELSHIMFANVLSK